MVSEPVIFCGPATLFAGRPETESQDHNHFETKERV